MKPSSPFATLPTGEREKKEEAFLEFFDLAVLTNDDREEEWAFEQLRLVYAEAIALANDLAPSLFEAMAWAARRPLPMPAAA